MGNIAEQNTKNFCTVFLLMCRGKNSEKEIVFKKNTVVQIKGETLLGIDDKKSKSFEVPTCLNQELYS